MTLLLASSGLATRPATATWEYPYQEDRRRPRKLRIIKQQRYGNPLGRAAWVWVLVASLPAIVVIATFIYIRSLFPSGTAAKNGEETDRTNEAALYRAFESPYLLGPSRMLTLEENPFASIALSYPATISGEAKSLLGHENVGLLDAVQQPRLTLEHGIQAGLRDGLSGVARKTKPQKTALASRLARVTVYWPDEGDFYTRNRKSSTGTRLRDGHCAVDPKVIPYGSVVNVPGVGPLVAVDTGGAVVSRRAARTAGRTREQRGAIVIDIFCSTRSKALALIKRVKHFAVISWQRPDRVAEL